MTCFPRRKGAFSKKPIPQKNDQNPGDPSRRINQYVFERRASAGNKVLMKFIQGCRNKYLQQNCQNPFFDAPRHRWRTL